MHFSKLMAALDQKPQNDNKENVSPSMMIKPLDSCTSLDKDITQIRTRRKRSRRQPLKDITNLFVSSPPLSSSFMLDPYHMIQLQADFFYLYPVLEGDVVSISGR
ncbi:hypothetical protein HID58_041062 [Brassica napus]|uniref:Uncharacterized protein n=1 Tax=Brassica napus TaxID=3708 RepID=A0ABQ8B9T1_BRANA|nr:hypothetical protein HID58_041062 [Brassica napus]